MTKDEFERQTFEAGRRNGRFEVFQEIAALPNARPESIIDEHGLCPFCAEPVSSLSEHKPTCLWLRARHEIHASMAIA